MNSLKERIRREGRVLPGDIVKVDGFLNHRVDVAFMEELAEEFAKIFPVEEVTMVLTAEASGIACSPAFCEEGEERQHRGRIVPERYFFLHLQEKSDASGGKRLDSFLRQGAHHRRFYGARRGDARPV